MSVVYEVNLEVDRAIEAEYRVWLAAHVREMLGLPGFATAEIYEVFDPAPTAGRIGLSVRYLLSDADALQAYLREHAPRMRAEGVARFGDGFRARRRLLRAATLDQPGRIGPVPD